MKNKLETALAKYLAGEASAEEKTIVEAFKKANPDEFNAYKQAYLASYFDNKDFDKERMEQMMLRRMKTRKFSRTSERLMKIAALFAGLFAVAALSFYLFRSETVIYTNNTASKQHLVLPDGSKITLDKGAVIEYRQSLAFGFDREVTMQGRIFFNIVHKTGKPFKVCEKRVSVLDLGTEFIVNQLENRTQIILLSGKINVISNKEQKKMRLNRSGDRIVADEAGNLKQSSVNPRLYASWTESKIYFDGCTVGEVLQYLRDSYDIEIDLNDTAAINKKLSGSAPSDNPVLILKAISQIIHKKVVIN